MYAKYWLVWEDTCSETHIEARDAEDAIRQTQAILARTKIWTRVELRTQGGRTVRSWTLIQQASQTMASNPQAEHLGQQDARIGLGILG